VVGHRTLVLGGARSGKSAHAEGLLPVAAARYLATARPNADDPDWTARIAAHVRRRSESWSTEEVADPAELPRLLAAAGSDGLPVLVDDIATWLTAVLDDAGAWDGGPAALRVVRAQLDALVLAVAGCAARLVLVSAEVGLGVVPSTSSGRLFRDTLGALNARLGEACDEAVLLVAGLPVQLKPRGGSS
jgi:adenosylcobinamide kinase/adenosylcobinamide-phosphate guanylyltransferase